MSLPGIKKSSNNISVAHVLHVLIEKLLIAIVSNNSTRKIAKKQKQKKISNGTFPFLVSKSRDFEVRSMRIAQICVLLYFLLKAAAFDVPS